MHASFYDFISDQALSQKHYLDPGASHRSLAHHCLSLMDREWSEKKDISYLADRRGEEIPEPLVYACSSWAFHLTKMENNNSFIELKAFFERHLLQWMDCLSILGKLGIACLS